VDWIGTGVDGTRETESSYKRVERVALEISLWPTLLLPGVNSVSCTFHHSKSIYLHLPVNSSHNWYESLRKE